MMDPRLSEFKKRALEDADRKIAMIEASSERRRRGVDEGDGDMWIDSDLSRLQRYRSIMAEIDPEGDPLEQMRDVLYRVYDPGDDPWLPYPPDPRHFGGKP